MPKRKAYTIQEKLDIITRIRKGETQSKVSRETSVPESTLRGWLKDEVKLREFVHTVEESDGLRRKKARVASCVALDTAVLNWFIKERQTGLPISGPVLKAQAEKFDKSINGPDSEFSASQGWLWRWQKRHRVSQMKIVGEKRSADENGAARFPSKLLDFIDEHGLCDEQIYNPDETGLYYRMLPDRTLAMKSDGRKGEGFKLAKDRTTMLFCCNKTGTHKLQPLCIGKFASPRCFHHVNMNTMPIKYTSSGNAWMTAAIFQDWYQKTFVPAVRRHLRERGLKEEALLLLDNCRAHPPAEKLRSADGRITVMYLPPNTTSIIQPLNQGVISSFKRHYRRELVKEIVLSELDVTPFLKQFRLKEMFFVAGRAWETVTAKTIENCWMEGLAPAFPKTPDNDETDAETEDFLGFNTDEIAMAERRLADQLNADESVSDLIEEWATIDQLCPVVADKSDEQIVNDAIGETDVEDTDVVLEEDTVRSIPSVSEAVAAFEVALRWIECQQTDTIKVLQTSSLLNYAKQSKLAGQKQKKVTDFFSLPNAQ